MYYIKIVFVSLAIAGSFQIPCAQDDPRVINLYEKVKLFEDKQSDTSTVVFRKGCSDRKYFVKSKMDVDSLVCKSRIKYFRSGSSREKAKYFSLSPKGKNLVLYVVKINSTPTYINYIENGFNYKKEVSKVKEEILIDNKFYLLRVYDRNGILTGSEYKKFSK